MALPTYTMRQLLEAGVHFGHNTRRWNPKMAPYLFGVRNGIHIIDLQQTVPMLHRALVAIRDVVAGGGRVLFVGTKRQASERIAEAARRCGQYYVNHRWLGGMMTNWETISGSIKRLKQLDARLAGDDSLGLTKKELLMMTRERDKLERSLGGIKDMGGLPNVLVVLDTNKEDLAVQEARKLGIPVVAVIDSNSNPKGVDYPVPGNDDAIRSIEFYCEMVTGAVLDGIQAEVGATGGDIGEMEAPTETLPEEQPVAEGGATAESPIETTPEVDPAVAVSPATEEETVAQEEPVEAAPSGEPSVGTAGESASAPNTEALPAEDAKA